MMGLVGNMHKLEVQVSSSLSLKCALSQDDGTIVGNMRKLEAQVSSSLSLSLKCTLSQDDGTGRQHAQAGGSGQLISLS